MKVSELMTRDVKTCLADEDMTRAAQIMWDHDCGVVPIIDGARRVVGMITDRDVCMAAYTMGAPLASLRIGDAMAKQVYSCSPDDSLEVAMSTMRRARVRRLPVVDALNELAGVLSLSDVAREVARQRRSDDRQRLMTEVLETLAAVCETRKSCPIDQKPAERARASAPVRLAGVGS